MKTFYGEKHEIQVLDETDHYLLLKRTRTDSVPEADGFTVVSVDFDKGQVYNAMPGDAPTDGGSWFAGLTYKGICYVAGWYSRSYARRIFRKCKAEED